MAYKRNSVPAKRRPSAKLRLPTSLELMGDAEGSVAVGWVSPRVVYARMQGGLSASVGIALSARLQTFVDRVSDLDYFVDASALSQYDLLARSAFVRLVLANRRKFKDLVILTWSQGISPASLALKSLLGEPTEILTNSSQFHGRLLRAAPDARHKLDPSTWVQVTLPTPESR